MSVGPLYIEICEQNTLSIILKKKITSKTKKMHPRATVGHPSLTNYSNMTTLGLQATKSQNKSNKLCYIKIYG